MRQPIQKRARATRDRLVEVAAYLVRRGGFEALRVEEVVLGAGVAKGTFFAHFRDKDALLDLLIGAEIDTLLDAAAARPAPRGIDDLMDALMPLVRFMASERYAFDVILRYSGAAVIEEIGPIAATFVRQDRLVAEWVGDGPFRDDVPPALLSEGVQAFLIQTVALEFCAAHQGPGGIEARLRQYLMAWLLPAAATDRGAG
mgnify:CR=1 FL=1